MKYGRRKRYRARPRYYKRKNNKRASCFTLALLIIIGVVFGGITLYNHLEGIKYYKQSDKKGALQYLKDIEIPDWVDVQLIHLHNTARTGTPTKRIKNIVIHYVGNPKTTAQNNRDYFDKDATEVSSHFVVGLDGEIIQCVPLWEKSSASNWRNIDTISIEVCHPDESGKFGDETYLSVVKLTAWLCGQLKLEKDDVIRHYDITEKLCPLYYVENENEWQKLKKDVEVAIDDFKQKK